jgi:DNA-binding IscR family transcriptional regulator
MLHVLLHMVRRPEPLTSESIAAMLRTNPVVVRRTMAGLREAGYVRSERGHGGGWTLACDPASITLLDVHRAVGGPTLFAIGNESDNPQCLVEQTVSGALAETLREAEALLLGRLGAVTLAALARDFDARWSACFPADGSA